MYRCEGRVTWPPRSVIWTSRRSTSARNSIAVRERRGGRSTAARQSPVGASKDSANVRAGDGSSTDSSKGDTEAILIKILDESVGGKHPAPSGRRRRRQARRVAASRRTVSP